MRIEISQHRGEDLWCMRDSIKRFLFEVYIYGQASYYPCIMGATAVCRGMAIHGHVSTPIKVNLPSTLFSPNALKSNYNPHICKSWVVPKQGGD